MPRTAQISKEKQVHYYLRHECQSKRKYSRTLKVSSSEVSSSETGSHEEDPELPLLQRISSVEFTAPQIAAQINASQSSRNTHISTCTVHRRLRESGLHDQIVPLKPLLKDEHQ